MTVPEIMEPNAGEVVAERVEFLERAKTGTEEVDFGEMGEEVPYYI